MSRLVLADLEWCLGRLFSLISYLTIYLEYVLAHYYCNIIDLTRTVSACLKLLCAILKNTKNSWKFMQNSIIIDKNSQKFSWTVKGDLKMLRIPRNPRNCKNLAIFSKF